MRGHLLWCTYFMYKILERAVCSQLAEYLDSNNLMQPNQSAYRRSHSTETTLTAVFSDNISELDRGNLVLLSMLDRSAAFDCVDHDILLNRLDTSYGIRSTSRQWLTSYLSLGLRASDTTALFTCWNNAFRRAAGLCAQTSVIPPLHCRLRSNRHQTRFPVALLCGRLAALHLVQSWWGSAIQDALLTIKCIADIKAFMRSNRLRLNPTKTEFSWCTTARRRHQVKVEPIHIDDVDIAPSADVRNLGVLIDGDFSMTTHVKKQVRSCFHSLCQIRVIRRSLTKEAAKMLVCSFICSRIDYCNAVFAGLPRYTTNHLDSVLHAATRMISSRSKYDHLTSVLRDEQHWLPVQQHMIYKLCLITYKAINGTASSYIAAMCVPSSTNHASLRLRSFDSRHLLLPRPKTELEKRAFAYAEPRAWNDLPIALRTSTTLTGFKSALKTHLFHCCYPTCWT